MSSLSPFSSPISHRLAPQSRGSLKVNPRQELSVPPILVRKSAQNKNSQKKKTQRTDEGAAVFPLPSLALFFFCLLFSFPSSISRCDLVTCYRKEIVLLPSSSYPPSVVIPLLLSSALRLNAAPSSHTACKYTQYAAVLPYISLVGGECVRSLTAL